VVWIYDLQNVTRRSVLLKCFKLSEVQNTGSISCWATHVWKYRCDFIWPVKLGEKIAHTFQYHQIQGTCLHCLHFRITWFRAPVFTAYNYMAPYFYCFHYYNSNSPWLLWSSLVRISGILSLPSEVLTGATQDSVVATVIINTDTPRYVYIFCTL
jgi:hypothetical protein